MDEIEAVERKEGELSERDDYRNDALAQLRAKRELELSDEGLSDGMDEEGEINTDNGHNDDEFDVNTPVETEPTSPTVSKKHTIKVNGRDIELSYDELIAKAQKVEAADEYLRRAKEASDNVYAQPSQDVEVEMTDLELVRAIQMGGEDEAVEAMRRLRQSNKPQVDTEDIIRLVEDKARAQAANEKFQNDYKDVFNDPILSNLACQEDNRQRASGDTRPYDVRYAEIGNNLRNWRDSLTSPSSDKVQRKINAPQVPKAAGRAQAPVEQVEHEETRQEMIARIAKSRGQQY
jgi:hypothetical protein